MKRFQYAAGALCAALLLASCGGGGGGNPPPAVPVTPGLPGSYADPITYSSAANGSLSAPAEGAAVVPMRITLAGKTLDYTATTGHLTATDPVSGQPVVSFFYVAYTAGTLDPSKRPVTFFYNGGPGSSSLWLHLGSFGPKRIVTAIPSSVMPSPVQLVENQETLLANSDLVFVDAIGTGFSQAVAPRTNLQFWGVDSDAGAFRDFVRRYVTVNNRQTSPKYLFGESYGAPRTGVLANLLEVAGVKLSGIVLQSAIMNYSSNCGVLTPGTTSCEGYIPSYAAVSAYYKLTTPPGDFNTYLKDVRDFSAASYRPAVATWLQTHATPPVNVVSQLISYSGLDSTLWNQNFALGPDLYRTRVASNTMIGRYDARVSAVNGSALTVDNDPSLTVVNAAFNNTIQAYILNDLRYSARSSYVPFNDIIGRWNFSHDGKTLPDTIPDVAAAMTLNPALKVVAMSGYYDLATPFYQTELDLARLGNNPNIQIKNYASGHMSYLDDATRRAQRDDMLTLYNSESVAK
ncbi:peptidase S10 [Massilia sp. CF038]|uniref:S10 family serine carboxypeptidase-like protein n=1 Tax=Massilia sp. CF038 TaxID=1881045 RepID=UPI0009346578|nr:peptidase S10 [Massilia sp. CF038]